jgi:hypothetical protein
MRHARHYTLDEARAKLAWVAEKLVSLRDARDRLTDQDTRRPLVEDAPTNGGGHRGKQVGEAFVELQNGIAEFDRAGIVLRDLDTGLIDFPSIRDGQEIYLCWIDGEDDIEFWHDLDAGFAGREPL